MRWMECRGKDVVPKIEKVFPDRGMVPEKVDGCMGQGYQEPENPIWWRLLGKTELKWEKSYI